MGASIRRNRPFIRFPCFEMVVSASNLLITVAGSISTPSLSVNCWLRKLLPFPPIAEVSDVLLRFILLSVSHGPRCSVICGTHYRPTLGTAKAPSPCRRNPVWVIPHLRQSELPRAPGHPFVR